MFLSFTFCQAASRSLASARHGGHHEAQKFRNTALPRKSAEVSFFPSKRVTVKGAAGLARSGDVMYRASRLKPKASSARIGAMIKIVIAKRRQGILVLAALGMADVKCVRFQIPNSRSQIPNPRIPS